jgi:hypothetical protein
LTWNSWKNANGAVLKPTTVVQSVTFRPLMKTAFSATDEPANDMPPERRVAPHHAWRHQRNGGQILRHRQARDFLPVDVEGGFGGVTSTIDHAGADHLQCIRLVTPPPLAS